jgi:hypothetical protein
MNASEKATVILADYEAGRMTREAAEAGLRELGADTSHIREMLAICRGESDVQTGGGNEP